MAGTVTASALGGVSGEREPGFGGERREVTVAFADIRGFTTLAECLSPEELITVLNTYLAAVIKAFLKHGGVIDKFGGDSIMAVWNAPGDCPAHALQATVAAIEAQQAVKELQRRESTLPKIGFGIGINTGKVTAGYIGCEDRMEYSVIGDTVNIASRLSDAVPAGKVWATLSTFELVEDYLSTKPLAPLAVKGKRQRVKAYEVLDGHGEESVVLPLAGSWRMLTRVARR
jgi:adenylate cyclase